jgi:hypothetical protein
MRIAILTLTMALAAGLGCANLGGSEDETPLRREATEVVEFTARVKALDLAKREVTLTDASGGEAVFQADAAVKNLAQVKVGDEVAGALAESVVLEAREPTPEERAAGTEILEVSATAPLGHKPAGVYVRQIVAILTVEALDPAAGTGTLRGPAGKSHVLPVRNPRVFERVKVGDTVVATYTEALRLEVRSAP